MRERGEKEYERGRETEERDACIYSLTHSALPMLSKNRTDQQKLNILINCTPNPNPNPNPNLNPNPKLETNPIDR